jgi:hypothetical protein
MRLVLLCVALAFVSTSAIAGEKPETKNPIDPSLKIVCKTQDVVGSKIPKRICMTKGQWEQEAIDARAALDDRSMWKEVKGKGPN